VLAELASLGVTEREWHSYSRKAGWSLKTKRGERTIAYLLPHAGGFRVALVFGDKAIAAIRAGGFPQSVIDLIDAAKRYAEGTGIRLDVSSAADVALVGRLVAVKLAH
jgi:hypothetical protein